ncbi:helix-turn-helix transcriptional regulator [Paracoccus sp. M683]|nr:helix-turn-helix transcriptional regulator [Paracoccus sp. M683]
MGDRIAVAREAAGLAPEILARKLGVRTTTLAGWEDDQREPRANHLRMIAGLLGVSLIWLLSGQGAGPSADDTPGDRGKADRAAAMTELRGLQQSMRDASRRLARLEQLLTEG